MYILSLRNIRTKLKKFAIVIASGAFIFLLISILSSGFADEQAVENKSEKYPGEPIRVTTEEGFESLTVWEAILHHYCF